MYVLYLVLHAQDRLETFSCAVTDGIALFSRAEWPCSLASVTIGGFKVLRIFLNLAVVQPSQSQSQTLLVFRLFSEASLHERLCDESNIPKLAAIHPRHHHAFCTKPHEVCALGDMSMICLRVRTINNETTQQVHRLGDRVDGLIFGVFILVYDEFVGTLQRSFAKSRYSAALIRR